METTGSMKCQGSVSSTTHERHWNRVLETEPQRGARVIAEGLRAYRSQPGRASTGEPAIDEISFELESGTSLALIGPNGSGKTTLLHCVAGLIEPAAGSLIVDPATAPIAYVTQQLGRRDWMPITVTEVLRMGRYKAKWTHRRLSAVDREAIDEASESMAIHDLLSRQFGELSGGQRQRVLIAQALVQKPALLLLDEPITGLDLASQERILNLVTELTAAGTSVILSTHHLDEARHCDLVALLNGRMEGFGPPEHVLQPERLKSAFGTRTLGDHHSHDHDHALLILDNHGHGSPDT